MHQFELAMQTPPPPPPPKKRKKLMQELYIKLCQKNLDQFIDNFKLESHYQKFNSIFQVNREGRISHWKITDQYAD